jgi:hypothetical protein
VGKIDMRLIYLPIIALMAMAAPAFAGTDSSETPNPFTDPSAGQTTTSGVADSARIPGVPAVPGSDQQLGHPDDAKSSGSFYQEQKKDSDGH